MRTIFLKILSVPLCIALVGCSASTGLKPDMKVAVPVVEERVTIELECKSASNLGCRHKGYVYPWNAWLDEKGYDAKDYELKDVIRDGSRATVVIVER